jgi:hypothetical protein
MQAHDDWMRHLQNKSRGLRLVRLLAAIVTLVVTGLPARAETVDVRYRGPVDVTRFACSATTSSVVGRVCYDRPNHYMVIQLSGVYYHYCGVDPQTVSGLLAAASVGGFYNANIRGQFDCRVIPPPR